MPTDRDRKADENPRAVGDRTGSQLEIRTLDGGMRHHFASPRDAGRQEALRQPTSLVSAVAVTAATTMVMLLLGGTARALHYLTCRHGYEPALLTELARSGITATSPCAAVARCAAEAVDGLLPDPTYALQILPHATEVSGVSIKELADGAAEALGAGSSDDAAPSHARELLSNAPRGAMVTHCLVPDLLRGAPPNKAKLLRRCDGVADKLNERLKRRFAAARPSRDPGAQESVGSAAADSTAPPLQLQLLLLEPELLVVSLAPSAPHRSGIGFWPVRPRGGFVDCSLDGDMPSSAYRKLLESFELMHTAPRAGERCVDLGACPGGWTAAMRRQCDVHVTAVDRSPLVPYLLNDPKVDFIKGDAFEFAPSGGDAVDWMVSDVAAYPERAVELIDRWCREKWARHMTVTMKFTGDTPPFDSVEEARKAAVAHGYRFRAMHHFSNKKCACTAPRIPARGGRLLALAD